MPITLYHVEWCPDCHVVRRKLADLGLAYEGVIVPDSRRLRAQVHQVSGQYYVPVLQDGERVLTETADILTYLEERYGSGDVKTAGPAPFQSQGRATLQPSDEDDEYPSCRIH